MPETELGITSEFPFRIPWAPAAISSPPHQSPDRFRPISRGRFRRRFGGDENYGVRSGSNVWKHAPILLYYYVLLSRKNRRTGREASMVWQRLPPTVIQLSHCHCDTRLAVVCFGCQYFWRSFTERILFNAPLPLDVAPHEIRTERLRYEINSD